MTFEPTTLPSSKVRTWFKAPAKDDEEIISCNDDSTFQLLDLLSMQITHVIAERGYAYYMEKRVRYICLDGFRGYAIVEGGSSYEVEFEYRNGEIGNLLCDCPCSYNCKHEFAVMLQLKETLDLIAKHYAVEYDRSGYFAAVNKAALFDFAVDRKETGSFTL